MTTPGALAAADKRRILDPVGELFPVLRADGSLIRTAQQGADDVAAEARQLEAPVRNARNQAGPLSNLRRGAETDKGRAIQAVDAARPVEEDRILGQVLERRGGVDAGVDEVSTNANDPDVTTEEIDFDNASRIADGEVETGIRQPIREAPPEADDPDRLI